MTFPSHLSTHSVCRSLVRPRIQIVAKGQVGLQLIPRLQAHLSDANSQTEDERVYIMGTGIRLNLFAYSLAKKPSPPPITLLWEKPALAGQWEQSGKYIHIKSQREKSWDKQSAFDTEEVHVQNNGFVLARSLIRNLIVCTSNEDTIEAISKIKHRLNEQSTVLFVHASLRTTERVPKKFFPDLKSRPTFLAGISLHHLQHKGVFRSNLMRPGPVSIAVIPRRQSADAQKGESDSTSLAEPSRYLIQQILDSPYLTARETSNNAIIHLQISKLVVRAMTYPLSVIFDRTYGELFGNAKIQHLMKLLLSETSHVLRALPELQEDEGLAKRYSPEGLENRVMGIIKRYESKKGRAGPWESKTIDEIDHLNGYIVKKGKQLGIDCVHNRTLVTMWKKKRSINMEQIDEFFPPERGS